MVSDSAGIIVSLRLVSGFAMPFLGHQSPDSNTCTHGKRPELLERLQNICRQPSKSYDTEAFYKILHVLIRCYTGVGFNVRQEAIFGLLFKL